MSTAKGAAEALQKINFDTGNLPKNYQNLRVAALDALSTKLETYVQSIDTMLDDAYNRRCRRDNWYPIALSDTLLGQEQAQSLQYEQGSNKAAIHGLKGFKALEAAGQKIEVLFKISIRPDSVAVICDFLNKNGGAVLLAA